MSAATGNSSSSYTGEKTNQDKKYAVLGYRTERAYGPLSNNKVPVRRARNADYGPLSDNKVPVRRARNTDYGPLCDNEVPVRRAWKTHYVSLRAALRTEADQKQKRRPMQAWGVTFSLLIPGLVHPRGGCSRSGRSGLLLCGYHRLGRKE